MEMRQIEYFVTAHREGTISQAARVLHLAQPSLSAQIRKLERELGSPVFARLGRRLALTPAGETFLPYAERVLAAVADGKREVRTTVGRHAGHVSMGTLPSVDAALLPKLLRNYAEERPETRIDVFESNSANEFEGQVHRGELDLAIQRLPLHRPDLACRLLVREPLLLLVPPGHRLADRLSATMEELRDEPFVVMKQGHGLRNHVFELCRAAGFEPRISLESNQLDGVREMVAAGWGLAIVPQMLAVGSVPWLRIDSANAIREIGVIWRPGPTFSTAANDFLEFLLRSTASLRPQAVGA